MASSIMEFQLFGSKGQGILEIMPRQTVTGEYSEKRLILARNALEDNRNDLGDMSVPIN